MNLKMRSQVLYIEPNRSVLGSMARLGARVLAAVGLAAVWQVMILFWDGIVYGTLDWEFETTRFVLLSFSVVGIIGVAMGFGLKVWHVILVLTETR